MNNGSPAAGFLILFLMLAIGLLLYFIPAIIAHRRGHAQVVAIFFLNLLAGWSFIGWLAALIWALTNPTVVSSAPVGGRASYSPSSEPVSDTKTCPRCAETVKAAAQVCRFCGHEFPPTPRTGWQGGDRIFEGAENSDWAAIKREIPRSDAK